MCCFSGGRSGAAKVYVSGTQIFARSDEGDRQLLVYGMTFSAQEDIAMILPLPVPPSSAEDAVRFIDLSSNAEFFETLDAAFPQEQHFVPLAAQSRSLGLRSPPPLEVHSVGAFEASFVPTLADFSRLDERFRISDHVWAQLPDYKSYGFAVFKLRRPGLWRRLFGSKKNSTKLHPMAFSFPRRDPTRLFFPTVHVHSGKVHKEAHFDHLLYYQADKSERSESPHQLGPRCVLPKQSGSATAIDKQPDQADLKTIARFMRPAGLIAEDRLGYRLKLQGNRANHDTLLELTPV